MKYRIVFFRHNTNGTIASGDIIKEREFYSLESAQSAAQTLGMYIWNYMKTPCSYIIATVKDEEEFDFDDETESFENGEDEGENDEEENDFPELTQKDFSSLMNLIHKFGIVVKGFNDKEP